MVKLSIALNGDQVDALSCIVHAQHAHHKGKDIVQRLKKVISRQQYVLPSLLLVISRQQYVLPFLLLVISRQQYVLSSLLS